MNTCRPSTFSIMFASWCAVFCSFRCMRDRPAKSCRYTYLSYPVPAAFAGRYFA
jgi:hypothetical protein